MAYVRRTQQLVDDVRHKVDTMRDDELIKVHKRGAVDIGTPLYDDIRTALEAVLWEPAPDIKDKMPNEWCLLEESIVVSFRLTADFNVVRHTLETPTDDKIKLPPNYSRWDTIDIKEPNMTPLIKAWVEEQLKVNAKREETMDLFKSIKDQLTNFLNAHASLNSALKAMPELEMYVPQKYYDKVNEKVVRVKKEKEAAEEVDVDVDALTRAAVAHRMTSGN